MLYSTEQSPKEPPRPEDLPHSNPRLLGGALILLGLSSARTAASVAFSLLHCVPVTHPAKRYLFIDGHYECAGSPWHIAGYIGAGFITIGCLGFAYTTVLVLADKLIQVVNCCGHARTMHDQEDDEREPYELWEMGLRGSHVIRNSQTLRTLKRNMDKIIDTTTLQFCYHPAIPYCDWEGVMLGTRVVLTAVYSLNNNAILQAMYLCLGFITCLVIHTWALPYVDAVTNHLQRYLLSTLTVLSVLNVVLSIDEEVAGASVASIDNSMVSYSKANIRWAAAVITILPFVLIIIALLFALCQMLLHAFRGKIEDSQLWKTLGNLWETTKKLFGNAFYGWSLHPDLVHRW